MESPLAIALSITKQNIMYIVSQNLGFIVDLETGPDRFMYYVDITGSVGRPVSSGNSSIVSR